MKKLWILLIITGVLVMFKPINSIIKDSIGNIIYRGNVVTGIVATDNGDKSYDVFISESEKAYPHIFTLSANPILAVGDKVRILYKNGCKELPIILPPSIPTIGILAFTYCRNSSFGNNVAIYDLDSNLIANVEYSSSNYGTDFNGVAVDMNGNIYVAGRWSNKLLKLDKDGNKLIEVSSNQCVQVAIAPDGFVWTWGANSVWDYVFTKWNPDTLAKEDEFLSSGNSFYFGMAFDDSGYLYAGNNDDNYVEKWDVITHSRIAYMEPSAVSATWTCLAVIGNTLYATDWTESTYRRGDIFTCPTDLSSDFVPHNLSEITGYDMANGITTDGNYLYVLVGSNSTTDVIIYKYTTNFSLIWSVIVPKPSYESLSISVYPF